MVALEGHTLAGLYPLFPKLKLAMATLCGELMNQLSKLKSRHVNIDINKVRGYLNLFPAVLVF